jgi:prepilin-type N-terminal cleavage/methylation domain-containing protein
MRSSIRISTQRGFTLIEILMVLILVAVLAAVGMNAFINFRTEARNAALQANLGALRAGIMSQYAQMQLRCGTNPGTFPAATSLTANSITNGASTCTIGMVTVASERAFVQGSIPGNPWSPTLANTITNCATAGGNACVKADAGPMYCDGTAVATEAWCYNPATGEIWADSATVAREAR